MPNIDLPATNTVCLAVKIAVALVTPVTPLLTTTKKLETTQEVAGVKYAFSDKAHAEAALALRHVGAEGAAA